MKKRMKEWSILVKPTHGCNLNCEYCYDEPHRRKFGNQKMTFEIVDKIARLASEHAENVHWIWHGGEPTLMGTQWYKDVQEIFYKYYNTLFKQSLQTNGTLLDEEWMKLSKNYGIEIGMSFDVFTQGLRRGTGDRNLLDKLKMLKANNLPVGAITVINKENYDKQIDLYNFYKENDLGGAVFNHIYRSQGTLDNDLELPADEYVKEFMKYYDYWLHDSDKKAYEERAAMELSKQVVGNRKLCCSHTDCRHAWIGINPVGGVYPCDRYVPDKYYMGNIMDVENIEDLYRTPGYILYSKEIQDRFDTHCKECGYFDYCQGGCNANHIAVSGNGAGVDEFSCELFRLKFNEGYKVLRDIDIYEDKLNRSFLKLALEHPFITTKEIKQFLAEKGYTKELQYNPNGKELLDSVEFKLFRLFNIFKGESEGHIDYVNYVLKVSTNLENFSMKTIANNRRVVIEQIYGDVKEKINELLELNDRRLAQC